jgi:DNA-binding transcriptional LysR family regulator
MFDIGLEAFLVVARTLNISKAAEELNLAQSTVSKRLQVLEHELGTSLFERGQGAKSLRLTPAGEKFINIAQRYNTLRDEALQLQSSRKHLSLSIGTLSSLNYAVFPPLFRSLALHQPRLKLNIITSHSPELYEHVERYEVHVAFTGFERTHPTIITEKFLSDPLVVLQIASSAHMETTPVHPLDLDPNYELFFPAGLSYKIWHDQWWNPLDTNRINIDNVQLLYSFLLDERQWIILPLSVAEKVQTKGSYRISPLLENPPERVFYKITHKYPHASTIESMKVLDDYLKLYFPRYKNK